MACKTDADKKKARKHMSGIETFEMAGVPHGANRRRFAVLKEGESPMAFDVTKLEKAHAALGKVVTILKSGEPSESAAAKLDSSLNGIRADLAALFDVDGKPVSTESLLAKVDGIRSAIKTLDGRAKDLYVIDTISAVQEQADALETELKSFVAPAPVAVDVDATAVVEAGVAPVEEVPAEAVPAEEVPATPVEVAPVEVPSAAPVAPAATGEATTVHNAGEALTKSDLEAFGATLLGGFKSAVEELGQKLTVLKSAAPYGVLSGVQVPAKGSLSSSDEEAAPSRVSFRTYCNINAIDEDDLV